jgi:type I restriction enzyme S subunit
LEKQREIVKRLDSAFAEIASLEENLQLLEDSYEELLHSIQRHSFRANMSWVKIGDVCKLMTGGTPSRAREDFFRNGTVKWLVSGDIHRDEIFDCDGRITVAAMKSANTKILPINSVMIALNGQGRTRGTVALLRTEATCNQSLVSISPVNTEELLPEFLFYNLRMRYQELRRLTGDDGNDRRGLNMSLIREIEIPLPSIASQAKTIEDLKLADQSTQDLKKRIELKKEHVKNLRIVLLSKSFSKKIEVN